MSDIIRAARDVCSNWSGSGLAQAVRNLQTCLDEAVVADEATLSKARELYASDSSNDIEIDDDALVSQAEEGTWVQAWVWVPDSSD